MLMIDTNRDNHLSQRWKKLPRKRRLEQESKKSYMVERREMAKKERLKKERKKQNNTGKNYSIANLPEETIAEVLVRVSPYSLDNARLVCKAWSKIILYKFHLFKPSFIIQEKNPECKDGCDTRFVMIEGGKIRDTGLDFPCNGRIMASCNGLLLIESCCKLQVPVCD
uniref:F-box domain-containing protein n=1 Tax=Nelumbo nucifera TaxID=4432 RepID=A0A822Z9J0_NELNU|nr:TPA_asm: hypothetical protein HUJ06_014039 [Nelumbo nucifera]